MEMTLDMKDLDKPCKCGSGKLAGNCCRKDEQCPCGSGQVVSKCCLQSTHTDAEKEEKSGKANKGKPKK